MSKSITNSIAKGGGLPGSRKRRHLTKSSSTPGRTKTKTCQADYLKRYYAKRSRAYRDPNYLEYCISIDRDAGRHH